MRKNGEKHKVREGYEIGARPPELSEEAERQLRQLKVSPKLTALVEKARKAKVIRVNGFRCPECNGTAAQGPAPVAPDREGDAL